jgi:NTE family protein
MNSFGSEPCLGLAFSGGGVRALAHIGVLKTLVKIGARPCYLAGTSMGGVIAAAYAAGLGPDEIERIAVEAFQARNLIRMADLSVPLQGVFRGERLLAFFERQFQGLSFAELEIPLTLISVDLNSGREIHLCEGSVAQALRATVSVPGLFAPFERDGMRLVDGGLLNNLPVDVVKQMGADVVLAVDVRMGNDFIWQSLSHLLPLSGAISGLNSTLGDSLDVLIQQQRGYKSLEAPPDFLIQPDMPAGVTTLTGFNRVAELVQRGEQATRPVLPALGETLYSLRRRRFSPGSSHYWPDQRGESRDAGWVGYP